PLLRRAVDRRRCSQDNLGRGMGKGSSEVATPPAEGSWRSSLRLLEGLLTTSSASPSAAPNLSVLREVLKPPRPTFLGSWPPRCGAAAAAVSPSTTVR
ncbi:MAG: hypothetical protein ACK56F_21240, partial [bacterium]